MLQRGSIFHPPLGIAFLLLILGRHSRRKQWSKRHLITGLDRGLEFSGRWIAARCLDNGPWKDVFPRSLDQSAFAGSEISGSSALGMSGRDLILAGVGLFGQRIAIGKSIGPGHATRAVVVVQRLDPQIDRPGIALDRVRVHDPGLQQLEVGWQPVGARPTKQTARAGEAHDIEHAGDHDGECFCRPRQTGIDQDNEQQRSDQRVAHGQGHNDRLEAVHRRNTRTWVFGSRSAPLTRTLRNVSNRDFGRRYTSITLPALSSLNLNAVFSSPVWSTTTLSSKITCAVGLSFCTFTVAATGWLVVAWKCEMLTVYSPATMPRTVTISSRIGDGILLPLTTMKSLAPPRSSRSSVRKPASRCRYQAILPIGSCTNRSRSSGWLSGQSIVMINSALVSTLPSFASGEIASSAIKNRKAMTWSALNSITLNGSNGSSRG